ncbi:MAG: class I SAM-dependent methyltransferase [Acidobacteriota bacterium]|jgi:SAM-dependent methyltransferase
MTRKQPTRKAKLTVRNADRHDLYQRSVQSAETDVRFLSRRFKQVVGRPLRTFREDFCGTALLCSEFVKLHRENRAVGVDLHGPTLDWGRKRNLAALTEDQRRRITLLQANVLDVRRPRVDVLVAMNFSYWVFKTRRDLLGYLRNARRSVVEDGMLLVDLFGGSESQVEQEERTSHGAFTYVWDQSKFDPVTHDYLCKIHFEFRDGSRLRNAFVYDWRLWTLPEVQELMEEAGFRDVHVLWELTDRKTNRGNGVFRKVVRGDADEGWIAYVVGRR